MEPTIIAAIVSASGGILGKLIDLLANRDADAEVKAARIVNKVYDILKGNLTEGCIRILRILESGSLMYPRMLREQYYPALQVPAEHVDAFDSEFRYRLEYLRLNGLLTLVAGGEYGISRLGAAFLEQARRRRDYASILGA